MKKIIFIILTVMSTGAYALNVSANVNMKTEGSSFISSEAVTDGFIMKDGKMMMVNDGKFTPMVRDITLPNGTKVMKTGDYMFKGGQKMMLKEGDQIDMEGNFLPMNTMDKKMDTKPMPDKDMNMPDTTKMKDTM